MFRVYLPLVVLLVDIAVIVHTQNINCIGVPSTPGEIQPRLLNAVRDLPGETNTEVTVLEDPVFACQVQGDLKGTYQELSVVVAYVHDDQPQDTRVGQFQLRCVQGNANVPNGWDHVPSSLLILDPATVIADTPMFTNCSSCGSAPDSCQACDSSCNIGLMRCSSASSSDCCVAFEDDGTCKTDLNCNKNNFVANEQNNFTCACDLNSSSCEAGFIFNDTDCSCVLSDICMTQPPPCNTGSCILNSAPNDFTCNCTGSGFMGANCSVAIPPPSPSSSSSSSISISPSPSPSPTPTSTPTSTTTVQSTSTTGEIPTMSTTIVDASSTAIVQDPGPLLPAIIVSAIFGLLLIIVLIILVIYIIYYFFSGKGFALAKAKTSAPFADGESHNNPLYLKPDEVTSEVATLYQP